MTARVSILIPVYNAERWLAATLDAALAQTWPHTEIIAVDDGSTDDSAAILERYRSRGVTVIHQPNSGAGVARNRALAAATGDYLQFLDADDLLSPDKIAAQVTLLEQHPPGYLAVCDVRYFDDGSSPETGLVVDGWPLVDSDDPVAWLTELWGPDGGASMVQTGVWLVPRSVAAAAGPWTTYRSPDDDGEYFARVVLASQGLRHTPNGRSYYRRFPNATSHLSQQGNDVHSAGMLRNLDSRAAGLLARTDAPRARRAVARTYMEFAYYAYPRQPALSRTALHQAHALGGGPQLLHFGSPRTRLVARIFGWRVARRLSLLYHQAGQ